MPCQMPYITKATRKSETPTVALTPGLLWEEGSYNTRDAVHILRTSHKCVEESLSPRTPTKPTAEPQMSVGTVFDLFCWFICK